MLKIHLGDLEEIRQDPEAFRARRESTKNPGRSYTITQALKDAIFLYHKQGDSSHAAIDYLEEHLDRFRNRILCQRAVGALLWYMEEYQILGWPTFETRFRIVVPLSIEFADSLLLSGQVARVDLRPTGGYAAWLFRRTGASDWMEELQMPVIQNAVAVALGQTPAHVSVGVYCLDERYFNSRSYTPHEVSRAHLVLEALLRKVAT